MGFDRTLLPDTTDYFESIGHRLVGPARAKWKSTNCIFHGGRRTMRINTENGGWVCMSCDYKGGDLVAYFMAVHGTDFVSSAKALGAWVEDGRPALQTKPTPLSPRQALEVLGFEATLVAVAAGNLADGKALSDQDRARLLTCARRINGLAGAFA